MKVLKNVGKDKWEEVDKNIIVDSREVLKPVRKKRSPEIRLEQFFESLKISIEKNGYRTIKVSALLNNFSIKKRSVKNLQRIKDLLKIQGLYTLPVYSNELKWDSSLRLYNYPVIQLGDLFTKEKELENYVDKKKLYKKLNIKTVVRQHKPKGSKDKLDFKGDCDNEDIVVLELKNEGGGKSAVEQVLRYAALLTMEYPKRTIRQILVTGVQNYETALAIRGMLNEQRELFEWYLYKYIKGTNHFEFVKISNEQIENLTIKGF